MFTSNQISSLGGGRRVNFWKSSLENEVRGILSLEREKHIDGDGEARCDSFTIDKVVPVPGCIHPSIQLSRGNCTL